MNKQELLNKIKTIDGFDSSESKDWNRGFDDGVEAAEDVVKEYFEENMSDIEIPRFVADWIESHRQKPSEEYSERKALGNSVSYTLKSIRDDFFKGSPEDNERNLVYEWLERDKYNYFTLIDAIRSDYKIVDYKWNVSVGDIVAHRTKHTIHHVDFIDETGVLLTNGIKDESYSDDLEVPCDGTLYDFYKNFRLLAKSENLEN